MMVTKSIDKEILLYKSMLKVASNYRIVKYELLSDRGAWYLIRKRFWGSQLVYNSYNPMFLISTKLPEMILNKIENRESNDSLSKYIGEKIDRIMGLSNSERLPNTKIIDEVYMKDSIQSIIDELEKGNSGILGHNSLDALDDYKSSLSSKRNEKINQILS